jgi:inhibitor of KinA
MIAARLVTIGDSCVSLEFEDRIDPLVNARCVAIAFALAQSARRGVRDVVPTFNAVTVHFDPRQMDREDLATELTGLAAMEPRGPDVGEPVVIPVEYGGESGPDLAAVAEFGHCSEREVIQLHSRKVYRVYMLGFLPGFAYLGSVDPRIAMPRLDTPRIRVAAGSIGIAGAQTGIYPCDTPGGWRIIGRTATRIFDATRRQPSLLNAGNRVKFTAV